MLSTGSCQIDWLMNRLDEDRYPSSYSRIGKVTYLSSSVPGYPTLRKESRIDSHQFLSDHSHFFVLRPRLESQEHPGSQLVDYFARRYTVMVPRKL